MKKNNNNLMRVVSLVFAIVITLTLYLTETLPFSLLKPQAEASETADASPQANKEPVSDTESPVTGGKKLAIVVFDSFDKTMEEKTETWAKKVTLINPTDKPVSVHLFVQKIDACPNTTSNDCVQFPSSVLVQQGISQTVTITFTEITITNTEPIEGKLVIVGGDIHKEISFSITGKVSKYAAFWQKTNSVLIAVVGCIKSVIRFLGLLIITGLLGILIAYILYILLYTKVFPFLQPENPRLLLMDVSDDNKALWAVFSSRLREMEEQSYGQDLTVPVFKWEPIDLPANLGKEGDILKAMVELLNWILPRRGVSIRLESLEDQTKGKGLSVALVKNKNNQILDGHLFWANKYGISARTSGNDYLLMTPVIFWLSDRQAREKSREPNRNNTTWEAQAYSELARMLWGSERVLGKRLYMDALFHDPANKQAQNGLGRIWLEDSQRKDNSEDKKKDCLNFAVSYLSEVCKNQPKNQPMKKDTLWFASKYNLAVARLYQGEPNKAGDLCQEIFDEISESEKEKNDDFTSWLGKFKSMALMFKHSVILEKEPPTTQALLEEYIDKAIKALQPEMDNNISLSRADAEKDEKPKSKEWLLVTLNYRSQYNAACYFSRCYKLAVEKGFHDKNLYAETALDYLRLSLAYGGGLADFAREDQALRRLQADFKAQFDDIAPKKEESKTNETVVRLNVDKPIVIKSSKFSLRRRIK